VKASHELIANQVGAVGSLEAQLVGIVAALGAALGLFALVQHPLRADRLILLIGVGVALVTCVCGLRFTPGLDFGPRPAAFYQKLGGSASADYLAQLVSDLNQTIVRNDDAIGSKRAVLGLTLVVVALTMAVWLLVRAVN
jgi:hypothetical protein